MKSLIKKIANTNFGILIRNSLNIKPVPIKVNNFNHAASTSDAFHWRTDNGFKTKFKFSDILKLFYNIQNSWVELHFFTKDNKLIKIYKMDNLDLSNELDITPEFLNNTKDYGVFYIFHFSNGKIESDNIISNKCYLGFSLNNNLYSFVHGNTLAKYTNIKKDGKFYADIVKTSLLKNQKYTIQKYFSGFEKNELFFSNPTSKIINFSLENKNYKLNPGCSLILEIYTSIITIQSNCLFLRPTIFSYNKQYLDVHHS
jgi:hypothetical protein